MHTTMGAQKKQKTIKRISDKKTANTNIKPTTSKNESTKYITRLNVKLQCLPLMIFICIYVIFYKAKKKFFKFKIKISQKKMKNVKHCKTMINTIIKKQKIDKKHIFL